MKIVDGKNAFRSAAMLIISLLLTHSGYAYSQTNGESDSLELPLRGIFYYSWYLQTWTVGGKPVIFVYNANDNSCELADRWTEATNDEWYLNLKVFGGYRDCINQPDTWHQYGPATPTQQHKGNSFVISPGFWRADESTARLERDTTRWYKNVRDMVASKEPWQLVTTLNEWGEGTAIERCFDWQSQTEFGIYLDALHTDGVYEPVSSVKNTINRQRVHFYHNPVHENLTISGEVTRVDIYNINGSLLKG